MIGIGCCRTLQVSSLAHRCRLCRFEFVNACGVGLVDPSGDGSSILCFECSCSVAFSAGPFIVHELSFLLQKIAIPFMF